MNMIENHMEQIAKCSAAISELPFPPPKIFSNALLQPHDITALIRDTEIHERALFKVAPPEPGSFEPTSRKSNWFDNNSDVVKGGSVFPGLKSNTAVGRILGGDVIERLRRSDRAPDKDKAEVDINALLSGAERLSSIYPVAGATEKILSLRSRHEQLKSSITHYEALVAKQTAELNQASHAGYDEDDFTAGTMRTSNDSRSTDTKRYGPEDFEREEAEMRELEQKKQSLEDRVSGIDRDLGGLMR